jgi:hypothetical protein
MLFGLTIDVPACLQALALQIRVSKRDRYAAHPSEPCNLASEFFVAPHYKRAAAEAINSKRQS